MIGTRAHGKTKIYRYYSCYWRTRYDTTICPGARIDADAVEEAVTNALAGFYRHQHGLIADAITAAQASHAADQDARSAELAAAQRQLARTSAATDRYLPAFENGTLDPEDLAPQLTQADRTVPNQCLTTGRRGWAGHLHSAGRPKMFSSGGPDRPRTLRLVLMRSRRSCWGAGDDRFVADGKAHGPGNEALGMRFFVQPYGRVDHFRRRDRDPRPQDDLGELAAAILGLLHGSVRVVGVAGHRDT
jgi:recombinase-like zinc beta ribbon protein